LFSIHFADSAIQRDADNRLVLDFYHANRRHRVTVLEAEGRLLHEAWWLDDRYSYNRIPFQPRNMSPESLQSNCVGARREFYSWSSIFRRGLDRVNRADWFMWRNFYLINAMHRADVDRRFCPVRAAH